MTPGNEKQREMILEILRGPSPLRPPLPRNPISRAFEHHANAVVEYLVGFTGEAVSQRGLSLSLSLSLSRCIIIRCVDGRVPLEKD